MDADTEGLVQSLGRSMKVIKSIQESCQRLIEEQADLKAALELVRFYNLENAMRNCMTNVYK